MTIQSMPSQHGDGIPPMKQSNWHQRCLKYFAATLVGCGTYVTAHACFLNAETSETPRLWVATTEHDFGQVQPGATLRHLFTVRNVGAKRVVLHLNSCNCSADTFDNQILGPGDQVGIPVRLTTGTQQGRYQRTTKITTSDPHHPQIEFTVKAQIGSTANSATESPRLRPNFN